MKTLNRILIGTVLLATLFSCQDVVTYNDGYDDGIWSTRCAGHLFSG